MITSSHSASSAIYRPPSGSMGGSGKRRTADYMSVDTRAWVLHRASLATGHTGVERVSAAANANAAG